MEQRQLGRTDLKVSKICLGTMTFGEQNTEADAHEQMDYAFDQGVNFFDTAEMYPVPTRAETQGLTESYIGSWFSRSGKRQDVILATKIASSGKSHIRPDANLRASEIQSAVELSLKRLQTDYIDLYQMHWPSRSTNYFGKLGFSYPQPGEFEVAIEETLEACSRLVQAGKVRHVGVSNETPWGVSEYLRVSRDKALERIVSIQNPYSLLNRTFEVGLSEFAYREQVGLLAYSPLGMGLLSGKYRHGAAPENARLTLFKNFKRYLTPLAAEMAEKYAQVAEKHHLNAAQMALAFVNEQPFVTSNIIGATSMEQLKINIASSGLTLNEDVRADIDAVHQTSPNPCP